MEGSQRVSPIDNDFGSRSLGYNQLHRLLCRHAYKLGSSISASSWIAEPPSSKQARPHRTHVARSFAYDLVLEPHTALLRAAGKLGASLSTGCSPRGSNTMMVWVTTNLDTNLVIPADSHILIGQLQGRLVVLTAYAAKS